MPILAIMRWSVIGVFVVIGLASAQEPPADLQGWIGWARERALYQLQHDSVVDVDALEAAVATHSDGQSFLLFFPGERLVLAFLQRDWNWLSDTSHLEPGLDRRHIGMVAPARDGFLSGVRTVLSGRQDLVVQGIATAPGDQGEHEFLQLLFLRVQMDLGLQSLPRMELDRRADEWLRFHQGHARESFVRSHYHWRYEPYGTQWGMWIAVPALFLQGDARGVFASPGYGFALGFTVVRGAVLLDFGIGATYHEIADTSFVVKDHVWNQGDNVLITTPYVRLGVPLALGTRDVLIPSIHLGTREYSNEHYQDSADRDKGNWERASPWIWGGGLELRRTWGYGMQGFHLSFLVQYDRMGASAGQALLLEDGVRAEIRAGFLFGKVRRVL